MIKVSEILAYFDKEGFTYSFSGSSEMEIGGFCSLNNPKDQCVTWVKKPTSESLTRFVGLGNSLVVAPSEVTHSIASATVIITDEPEAVFFSILDEFFSTDAPRGIADDSTVLAKSVESNVSIGHHCYIGPDVIIGDNVTIHHNVVTRLAPSACACCSTAGGRLRALPKTARCRVQGAR